MSTVDFKTPKNNTEIYHGFQAQLKPAPIGKRLLANCVDYGILSIFSYVYIAGGVLLGLVIFGGLFKVASFTSAGSGAAGTITLVFLYLYLIIFILGFFAAYHGYFVYFEYKKGQTPGKKIFGLSVVTDDGSPREKSKMIIRELFRYIDTLIIPAIICISVTDKKQRIGDLMAGTFVAHSTSQESEFDHLYVKQADYNYIKELVEPSSHVDPVFRDEILLLASQRFLSNFLDIHMQDPYLQNIESRVREHFNGPNHERLDGRSALLFFAEYCYQIDIELKKEQKG